MKRITLLLLSFFGTLCAIDPAAGQIDPKILAPADFEALKNWVDAQKNVTIREMGGRLAISGEVRTECQAFSETRNGVKQRGFGGETNLPSRAYDIEVNVMIDYLAKRTWASIKLEFDNNAGFTSGTDSTASFDRIRTERAFFGARVVDEDAYTVDLLFGRWPLSYVFDSRVQFGSFMDGILLKYDHALDTWGDFFLHTGPFVVNERFDHYAWVGEIGLLNIYNTGLYGKYSLIDWDTRHYENKFTEERFRFLVSQISGGYMYTPASWNKLFNFYWAWLINTSARGVDQTHGKLKNQGWYTGFSVGKARKKGDWSFDINYQWIGAQAIPSFDVIGIGKGNAQRVGFYSQIVNGTEVATTSQTANGSTNYRGWTMQLLYLWTNNLTMYQNWSQSITLDKSIGPFQRYKMYEIELIYAF